MKPSVKLADFIGGLTWEGLPEEVRDRAGLVLLDVLGAAIAGSETKTGRVISDFVLSYYGGDEATVVLNGRSNPAGAALANGYMANALDIDDGGKYTRGHPGAQLVPTVLALGERRDSSGKEVIAALAAGYETAHRVGRCWHESFDEYRSCGSWGSVACAASASYILDLSKGETAQAVSVADYNSPYLPMDRVIEEPTMVKHGTGWGAMSGIMAAELGRRGFTGPAPTIDSDCEACFDDLGRRYVFSEDNAIEFKDIPSCSWGHPAIRAILELVEEHDVTPDEIRDIRIEGFSEMARLYSGIPATSEEAQFSVNWPVAVAVLDGEVTPDGISEERFDDPRLRELSEQVEVKETAELTEKNEELSGEVGETAAWPTRVSVTTHDGSSYSSGIVVSRSSELLDRDKITEKFIRLVRPYIPAERADRIVSTVRGMEGVTNIRELTTLIAGTN